jgi:hypothetical protein
MSSRTRAVVAVRVFAAFFFVAGGAALVVGFHDVTVAHSNLSVVLASVVLILSGALFVAAAVTLLSIGRRAAWADEATRPPSKDPVPIAFLVAFLVGCYVFFTGIGATGVQRSIVLGFSVLLMVAGIAGAWFFWRDVHFSLVRVGASIALTVVGIAVGVSEFWYQNQYAPSHLGRAVSLQADMKVVGHQRDYDVLSVTLNYQALGGTKVTVVGSTYTLTGSRVVRCERTATSSRVGDVLGGSKKNEKKPSFLVDPQTSRFTAGTLEERPATVLAAGKFVGDEKRLDPDVPQSRQMIFYVPRGQYQLLRFRAQLFSLPASVALSQTTPPTPRRLKGNNNLYLLWPVGDDSWLHDLLTGRQRWLVALYTIVDEPGNKAASPVMRVTARFLPPTWNESTPGDPVIRQLFATPQVSEASEPFADAELSVEPVTEPTTADRVPPACASASAKRSPPETANSVKVKRTRRP